MAVCSDDYDFEGYWVVCVVRETLPRLQHIYGLLRFLSRQGRQACDD